MPDRPLALVRSRTRRAISAIVLAVGGPILVTVAVLPIEQTERFKIAALVFLVPVLTASLVTGMASGLVAAVFSAALLEYYFTEPVRHLMVPSSADAVTLAVFALLAVTVARTVGRQSRRGVEGELAQRRLSFLAGANELLQRASLDFDKTVHELASLSVPVLADWCTIDVREDDGYLRTIAVAFGDGVRAPLAENLAHQGQPDPEAEAGIAAVLRTGEPELYPVVDEAVIRAVARDAQHAALLRGLQLRSLIIVPLFVRGAPIGAVKFASVRPDRRYGPEDLTLAEDLALRAGTALENVRLYQQRTHEAHVLQQTLLPARIPPIEGLEVEARFEPAGVGDLVGGDFYDVFAARDDRWLFIVGDVCGRGVEAAALTGLARHTLRAMAMREGTPEAMLMTLNDAIMQSEQDNFCTLVLASVRVEGSTANVRIVRAGHPPPLLLRADGSSELTGEDGSLLGVLETPVLRGTEVTLGMGDALVLYSDGILDERRDDPEEALLAEVRPCAGAHAKQIADRISEVGLTKPHAAEDDRAVLVLRLWNNDGGFTQRWT